MPRRSDVAHLCRRAGFGATPAEIAEFSDGRAYPSIDDVVEHLLSDPRLVGAVRYRPEPPSFSGPECTSDAGWMETADLGRWFLDRMAASRFVADDHATPHPLREKLTLFWHGLLVSSLNKDAIYCAHEVLRTQHVMFRRYAIGDYRTLLMRVSTDPAMLLYLDNWLSTADNPNENYARELLELFSLGVGNYSQAEVVAAARAGTGYRVSDDTLRPVFDPDIHDFGSKTFFGVSADWDLTGAIGSADGHRIVHTLCTAHQEAVARNISRLLWQYFAHFAPDEAIVADLVAGFTSSGALRTRDLLRAIFTHAEFYGPTARAGKVKNPVEYIVMLMRGLDVAVPVFEDGTDWAQWLMGDMGLQLFYQPTVFGWWRRPEMRWINLSAFHAKAQLTGHLVETALDDSDHRLWSLLAADADAAVDAAFARMGVRIANDPVVRERAIAMVIRQRRSGVDEWWQLYNLVRLAALSPNAQMN